MSAVNDIKSQLDLAQVAQLLGTDQATAGRAVDEALESLVGTMDANVADPGQAIGLTQALGDHLEGDAGAVDIEKVDTTDGEKIVGHVYSADQIQTLSKGTEGSLIRKLLPILAPIVMGYLASRLDDYMRTGGKAAPQAPAEQADQADQGGLGGILGDLLGGGQQGQSTGGGGLGDLLGSVLGGGQQGGSRSGGGLGDLLGGILGGGAAEPQAQRPAPTQQAPAGSTDGGFRVPNPGETSLNTQDSPTTSSPQSQAPAGGADGGLLGSILSDLLRGRR